MSSAATFLATRGGILMTMHSLGQGGGDRVAILLANGFAGAGIPTRLALMRDASKGQAELRALLHPGIAIESAGAAMGVKLPGRKQPLGHQHLERFRGARFIRSQVEAYKPAAVLAATDNMGFVTALARRRGSGGPAFAMKLTNALFRPGSSAANRLYRRELFRFIFARNELVITLDEQESRQLVAVYPGMARAFHAVPNPYVAAGMKPAPTRRKAGPPRLVTAGRMVPQKRFDNLLRALALSRNRDARLTILGDGPLRPTLERLAVSLGISERVEMPGYVEDVPGRLRQSDLFVLSSDYEGLPAVLIEALACNVPLVTTDSFLAARDLLEGNKSCAVVPIGDPGALAAAIDWCLFSTAKREGLREIAAPYGIEASVEAHIAALARVAGAQDL